LLPTPRYHTPLMQRLGITVLFLCSIFHRGISVSTGTALEAKDLDPSSHALQLASNTVTGGQTVTVWNFGRGKGKLTVTSPSETRLGSIKLALSSNAEVSVDGITSNVLAEGGAGPRVYFQITPLTCWIQAVRPGHVPGGKPGGYFAVGNCKEADKSSYSFAARKLVMRGRTSLRVFRGAASDELSALLESDVFLELQASHTPTPGTPYTYVVQGGRAGLPTEDWQAVGIIASFFRDLLGRSRAL